jgi:hypothetical protein
MKVFLVDFSHDPKDEYSLSQLHVMHGAGVITTHEYGMALYPESHVTEYRWARAESRKELEAAINKAFPDHWKPRIGKEYSEEDLTLRKNTIKFELDKAQSEWDQGRGLV